MVKTDRIVATTCPYYGVGCQMDLHLRGDTIVRVTGRRDNLVNFGNLCVKGRFGLDYVHAADRLRTPLGRSSRQQPLTATSWETALDTVADGVFGATYPNGCHIAEIEIDPETGAATIARYTAVDDLGNVINPTPVLRPAGVRLSIEL